LKKLDGAVRAALTRLRALQRALRAAEKLAASERLRRRSRDDDEDSNDGASSRRRRAVVVHRSRDLPQACRHVRGARYSVQICIDMLQKQIRASKLQLLQLM